MAEILNEFQDALLSADIVQAKFLGVGGRRPGHPPVALNTKKVPRYAATIYETTGKNNSPQQVKIMKHRIPYFILPLAILHLALPVPAQADEDVCPSSFVKITEENKRLSMLVPKSSGLGNKQSYDDIGCAVMARNEECASRQTMFDGAALAYDHTTGAEFPAETMYFVLKTDIKTPRGFGVVAFRDKEKAEDFSAGHGKGKVVKWYELVDEPLKR